MHTFLSIVNVVNVCDLFVILFSENAGYCILARSWVLVTCHLYQFDGCEVVPHYDLNYISLMKLSITL